MIQQQRSVPIYHLVWTDEFPSFSLQNTSSEDSTQNTTMTYPVIPQVKSGKDEMYADLTTTS